MENFLREERFDDDNDPQTKREAFDHLIDMYILYGGEEESVFDNPWIDLGGEG